MSAILNSIGDPFILGVNYWPRRKAMYWWPDFDAGEVREEFADLETGLSVFVEGLDGSEEGIPGDVTTGHD